MDAKPRIKIVVDRNGSYVFLFLVVVNKDGQEIENEMNRIVFKDKAALLEFKNHFITVFKQVNYS